MPALQGAETIAAYRYLYGKLAPISGSSGVYPGQATRGAQMPYIIVQNWPRPNGDDVAAFGGRVIARLRYLIKVISPTYAMAEPIVKAIDIALSDSTGQQSGYTILDVRRVEPFDMPTLEGDDLYMQTGGYYDLEVAAGVE